MDLMDCFGIGMGIDVGTCTGVWSGISVDTGDIASWRLGVG